MDALTCFAMSAVWVALAWASQQLPCVPAPVPGREAVERSPWVGVAFGAVLLSVAIMVALAGAVTVSLGRHFALGGLPGYVSLFGLGWIGSGAQIIAAACAVYVLARCWPVAVAVLAAGIWAIDYFHI